MTVGIVLGDASILFGPFVKGTIRYNWIVPFILWRHSFCEMCKRSVWKERWMSSEPFGVRLAAMTLASASGGPAMLTLCRKCES